MALLQNEEFAIWYLRTSYLANVKDGVAERLINVNSSILNSPGFRAAGWTSEPVQRTYSPPIPTSINTEYFQNGADLQLLNSNPDEEDEGGLVTGRISNDTIGPAFNARRRRRKEHVDEDDSSDLTDESEEEAEGAQRAAQQIRFAKMPARDRGDSSPVKGATPDIVTTSPPKPPMNTRKRTGSLGAVEAVKARARANTATSSDMSSENEVDPAYFQRRKVQAGQTSKSAPMSNETGTKGNAAPTEDMQDDSDVESVGSALSSDLGETIDSASLLRSVEDPNLTSSPPMMLSSLTTSGSGSAPRLPVPESPRRQRTLPVLHELPPPRPISFIQPTSLLSSALNAQKKAPSNPLQAFATLSGKGTPNPLWIKIYAPFSQDADEPFEMPLARVSKDGNPVTVAEAIGHSLWRYQEEKLEPALTAPHLNVNKWILRMVEDGEVDDDFPPLVRTRPITDFTYNNNRGGRGRSRERPFDEFALMEASSSQAEANQKDTPQFAPATKEAVASAMSPEPTNAKGQLQPQHPPPPKHTQSKTSILLAGQPFSSALANASLTPADQPAPVGPQATPRMGTTKTIRIKYFDVDVSAQTMTMEVSTDSYIAEILDHVCKRWGFEKAQFVLKVAGTNTVAPLDRTVEALGARSDLDLVRRRFGAGVPTLTGSPGSSSPNAPLLLDIQGPTKSKKGQLQYPFQKQELSQSASNFKKYYVTRKQLAPFAQGSQKVLVFDGDLLHMMPADTTSNAKTTTIQFSDVLRCKVSTKHSKLVRITCRRPTETKRYDLEARSAGEAQEIVDEITREMKMARA
ncbi:stress-activated map kinase interacting protein 1-domain-containing protein [Exophiala viscosa]|uniref:Stress-activated map kinase interacting protein 1-domain-containing protein n=1 Tax=Exophiala viscosa TaxID=2486360 RepID=A0AAN6DS31_9EURO|nr:stress-activated map kinase interacting protein 1-domain-containing protein [Exophiala viscosa]